ncbi:Long chronological lifespan protein 2 [Mucor velutinosus]|uniref:Long chronological lifespan protein 2 n=1 Tax=Mucor velutinosus TaxID=708070 RepID=A0AAN7DBR2_9FUNG|nr:Long chronological lifespan protein 2 [Mucor velutinosus]
MPTELDPHYYSKELNDSNVDIFDASTYNMPSVSAQDLKNKQTADAKSSYSGSSGGQSDCNALISRAMKYADYMTPPKKNRLELVMRVHLLGHVGINSMEKILHNDYKVHWTNMRNDIATVTKDFYACQSHGIYQVGYHPPRSVLPDNVFDHIAIDLGDFATTSTSGNNFLLVIVDYFS